MIRAAARGAATYLTKVWDQMSLFDRYKMPQAEVGGTDSPTAPGARDVQPASGEAIGRSVLGVETEYALTPIGHDGRDVDRGRALHWLFREAQAQLVHLPDGAALGMFLANGSRLYLDAGEHPELSTPECDCPLDVVRYTLAGERILARLAEIVSQRESLAKLLLFKGNVDYGGTGSTWGCHESYLHRVDPQTLSTRIIPHLVSRIVYSGAGGFVPSADGITFSLSPRVGFLSQAVSGSSTANRGIFHTKDEPLCRGAGFHRLHVLCGESLCSQIAQYLKVGTTALIVALIEADALPAQDVALTKPLAAMRKIARDPSLGARVELENGTRMTGIEIQRVYLEAAEAKIGTDVLPPWAADVCSRWRMVLDRLSVGPDAVANTLDWAIKRTLYAEHCSSRGTSWAALGRWSKILRKVRAALREPGYGYESVDPARVLRNDARAREIRDALSAELASRQLSWDALPAYLELRDQLFELDTRFGQIGEDGIFARLDRAGVLDHTVIEPAEIEDAMTNPPARGRAHERGTRIAELATDRSRYHATWSAIADRRESRRYDMGDPYGRNAEWVAGRLSREELLFEHLQSVRSSLDPWRD